ncbi:MAG: hypothetical protein EKK29_13280 [Hyphomicrobiales bacterium]|nr:MAG: hypothetical protein EKK29_13280 [Hyphomicrobiales bacterium]
MAEAFAKYRETPEWSYKAERTREEWLRAWRWMEPYFGDIAPSAVTMRHVSIFRERMAKKVSQREAHRCIKIWRALRRVAAALKYCVKDADPALGVVNTEPARRQELWHYREAATLVKTALRAGYPGLAALIRYLGTAHYPVDVRTLTPAQRARDEQGEFFRIARAKTGREAVGTLSKAAVRIMDGYLAQLGAEIAPGAAIFRNRSGAPYSKDTLGDDFRKVRALAFGPNERRTLADFRRSGASEALRGGASMEALGQKLANDVASSAHLARTYVPVDESIVRTADRARREGRKRNKV